MLVLLCKIQFNPGEINNRWTMASIYNCRHSYSPGAGIFQSVITISG